MRWNGTVSRLRSFIRIGIHPAGMLLFQPMRPTRTSIFPDENRIEVYDVESDVLKSMDIGEGGRVFQFADYWFYGVFMRLFPLLLRMATICCSVRRILSVCQKIIGMSGITCYESLLIRKTVRLEPKWIPYIMREKRAGVLSSRESPRMGSGYFIRCPIIGNFSIWHKDADLYMIDLSTLRSYPLEAANSDDVESYHSWSSNSRWLVFSSRRIDGLYTRPYLVHIDENGKTGKPFVLPQEDPDFYSRFMFSYNIPEFVKGKVEAEVHTIADTARKPGNRIRMEE